jgi:hypothetical protein
MMRRDLAKAEFVICIKNVGYAASLEVRKLYRVVPDAHAVEHHMVRVVDESGEDYLYPMDYFVPVKLPQAVVEAFPL